MTVRGRQRGLTLVELLVVVVILALASSLVLLNAPPARTAAQIDAEQLAARIRRAEENAILGGGSLRLVIDGAGYQFERKTSKGWAKYEADRALRSAAFSDGVTPAVEIVDQSLSNVEALGGAEKAADAEKGVHELALDPLGAPTPFTVRLVSSEAAYKVTHDASGNVGVEREP